MSWLRSHPYADALIGAGVLILLGAFIVANRSSVPEENTVPFAWGGVGAYFLNPLSSVPEGEDAGPQNLYTQVRGGPPFTYSPRPQTSVPVGISNDADSDLDALLAMLSSPKKGGTASGGNQTNGDLFLDAYAFIPAGLISTSTPVEERTPAQEELHNYGNEAGSEIQSFEDAHRNMAQTLKDQFEDPRDAGKIAALEGLGDALADVGRKLEAIGDVPQAALSANSSVAKSYREMGAMLALVPKAQTDEERVGAMLAYNATAETYIKNYVALATLFSIYDVTFASGEPGSVFMFTSGSF